MEVEVDDDLVQYGRELASAEVVNRVLRVPGGFLGQEYLLPLWIHPNYELLEQYLNFITSGKPGSKAKYQFHLVGTAGIGKSYFGHYWLYKQAKLKNKAIWRTKGDPRVFLYYDFSLPDPLVSARSSHKRPNSWTREEVRSVWMVVDGQCQETIDYSGPILQCVTPTRSKYHEFRKQGGGMFCYLEAWTLEELKSCSAAMNFKVMDLEDRFKYCGGIPRLVFDGNMTAASVKADVDSALGRFPERTKDAVKYLTGELENDQIASELLVHYELPTGLDLNKEPFMRVTVKQLKFASGYVAGQVLELYERQGLEEVENFVAYCAGAPMVQSLAGEVFEKLVHRTFKNGGGSYEMRSLNGQDERFTLDVKPEVCKTMHHWELTRGIAQSKQKKRKRAEEEGSFGLKSGESGDDTGAESSKQGYAGLAGLPQLCFVEPATNQMSYGSLFTPVNIFQVTVSKSHPVYWSGIDDIIKEFDCWHKAKGCEVPARYRLVFVVPDSIFEEYQFQQYVKEDRGIYKQAQAGMERVEQFAMAFPWQKKKRSHKVNVELDKSLKV